MNETLKRTLIFFGGVACGAAGMFFGVKGYFMKKSSDEIDRMMKYVDETYRKDISKKAENSKSMIEQRTEKKKEIGFGYLQKPVKSSDLFCQIEDIFEKIEYREELKSFQDELANTRKWACDVLKLNDITVEISDQDIKDDEIWSQYQAKVLIIVEKMKEEELQKTGKHQFETIKKELMQKYIKFEEKDMNFLATGEFLWKNYKDQLVDFSPILISYSKFLESVLRKMLLRRRIITNDEESMLGASIRELRYHPYSFGSYNKELVRKITYKLSDFTQYRNKAAHPEGVTSSMLESAKNILFATGKGEKMAVLDFIHLYY